MNNLSRPAKDCLRFFRSNPEIRINHQTLMEEKGLSRRKSYSILRELREANYVRIIKNVAIRTTIFTK